MPPTTPSGGRSPKSRGGRAGRGRGMGTRERIYRYVRERLLAGRPPTVREVQRAVGLKAVESARVHLERLVAEGRLAKEPGVARGYRLPGDLFGDGERTPALAPLLGRVQAGGLTAAIEEPEGYVAVRGRHGNAEDPRGGMGGDDIGPFALRVQGDSMSGIGILDGDVVLVARDREPRDGDVVVAMVGGDATVKTLRFVKRGRGKRLELHPANPEFEPIVPDTALLEILGRVVEVRRYLEGELRR